MLTLTLAIIHGYFAAPTISSLSRARVVFVITKTITEGYCSTNTCLITPVSYKKLNLISDKPTLYFPCFELRGPTPWNELYFKLP